MGIFTKNMEYDVDSFTFNLDTLSKHFDLDGLNLILGAAGSGKTTALYILLTELITTRPIMLVTSDSMNDVVHYIDITRKFENELRIITQINNRSDLNSMFTLFKSFHPNESPILLMDSVITGNPLGENNILPQRAIITSYYNTSFNGNHHPINTNHRVIQEASKVMTIDNTRDSFNSTPELNINLIKNRYGENSNILCSYTRHPLMIKDIKFVY